MTSVRMAVVAAVLALAGVCQADLVHRYSFNDGTANDSVGGANGLLVNGATVTGGQLVFDPTVNNGTNTSPATGQYVDLPDNIAKTRALTLEVWTTWGGGAGWQRIIDFGNSTAGELLPTDKTTVGYTGGGFIILTPASSSELLGQISINSWGGSSDTNYVAAGGISTGVEHHIVFTHDPTVGTEALYLDGQLVGQSSATVDPSTTNYLNHFLGRSNFSQDPFYDGTIDEFRIYDSYLTAQDVLADYQRGPNAIAEPPVPCAWQGSSGSSWADPAAWTQGVPNAADAIANFTGSGGSVAMVDGTVTLGSLNFSGATSYRLQPGTGTPSLTFSSTGAGATLTLSADAASQTISAPVSLASDLTVTSNANGLTLSGGISGGSHSVTLASGLLILKNTNTYSGNTILTGGTLRMGSLNAAAPGSTVVLSPGATLDLALASQVIGGLSGAGGTVTSGGQAALTINQAGDTTYSGLLSGAGLAVVKSGAGALALAGANTYAGGTTLSAGKLVLANSAGSALGTGNVVLNGGILAGGSVGSLTGDVWAGSGAHTISPGDHGSAGVLHTGSLYLTSNTTLDFSDITSTTTLDQIVSTGSLNFSGSGAATVVVPGALKTGTYTLIDFASAGTALASHFGMAGVPPSYALQIDAASYDLDLIVQENEWIGASGATWTDTGNWSRAAIPNGQGATALFAGDGGAAAPVNGTVTVASIGFAGSQSYNVAGGTSPNLVFDNGTANAIVMMHSGAADQTISTPVTLNSDLTVTNQSTSAITFSGGIAGTGKGITLAQGLLVLQGTNTYSGNTSIASGTLRMGAASAASPSSTVVLSPGATFDLNTKSQTIGGLSGAGGTVTSTGAATLTVDQAGSTTFSGQVSGMITLTKTGAGTLILGGANTYTGSTNVNGGTLRLGEASVLPTAGTININPGGTLDRGGYSIASTGLKLAGGALGGSGTLSLGADLTGFGTITGGVTNLGGTFRTLYVSGSNSLTIADQITNGSLRKDYSGTLILANTGAPNNWTGSTLSVTGGTLRNGASNQIPDAMTVNVLSGTTWDLNGFSEKIADLQYTANGAVNLNGGTLELANAFCGAENIHQVNIAGAGSLILSGGTLAMGVNNSHWGMTGSITITNGAELVAGRCDESGSIHASDIYLTNGRLALMNTDNRLVPSVRIHMSAGGTMLMKQDQGWGEAGINQTVAVLDGSGGTVNNNDATATHTLTVNPTSGESTFGGVLTNTGQALNVVKGSAGTWVLTGANSYTGTTTVSAGALRIGNASALGTVGSGTTVASGAALELYNNITTLAEALSIRGTGVANGGALRNVSDANTFAGPITLGAATRINSDSGTLTVNTISGPAFSLTFGGAGNTIVNGAINLTYGGLVKDGAGTATLKAANTISGPTTVSAGTLKLAPGATLGSTALDVAAAAVLDLRDLLGGLTLAPGTTLKGGGSVLGILVAGGTVTPGESPGILSVEDITFASTGVLGIELGGTARGAAYDVLDAGGTVTMQSGSQLSVSLVNGFVPQGGDTFDIMDFAGTSGHFTNVNLPTLGDGLAWDTHALYTTGTIGVTPEPATLGLMGAGLALFLARRRRQAMRSAVAPES